MKWQRLDDPLSSCLLQTELLFAATMLLGLRPEGDRQSLLVKKAQPSFSSVSAEQLELA